MKLIKIKHNPFILYIKFECVSEHTITINYKYIKKLDHANKPISIFLPNTLSEFCRGK